MKKLLIAGLMLANTLGIAQTNVAENVEIEYVSTTTNKIFSNQDFTFLNESEVLISNITFQGLPSLKVKPYTVEFKISNLKNHSEKSYSKDFNAARMFQGVINKKSKPYIIVSDFDPKSQQSSIFLESLTENTTSKIFNVTESGRSGFTKTTQSENQEHTLMYHESFFQHMASTIGLPNKNKSELFQFAILDNELNKEWSKSWEIPFSPGLYKQEDLKIDNDGNVFLLLKVYNKKTVEDVNGTPNYYHIVYGFLKKGESIQEYKITNETLFYKEAKIQFDNLGNLFCAGMAAQHSWKESMSGYFFSKFAISTGQQEFQKDNFFSESTLNKFNDSSSKSGLFNNIRLIGFEKDSKNNFYIYADIFEQAQFQESDIRNFNKIFSIEIDALGKTIEEKVVQRNFNNSSPMLGANSFSTAKSSQLLHYNLPEYRDVENKEKDIFANNLHNDFTLYVNKNDNIDLMPLANFNPNTLGSEEKGFPNLKRIIAYSENIIAVEGASGRNYGVWIIRIK